MTLTVTSRGQVTLRKDFLKHLGIEPGEKIEIDKMPDGSLAVRANRRTGTIRDLYGIMAGKTNVVATLEEINKATAAGWAGKR